MSSAGPWKSASTGRALGSCTVVAVTVVAVYQHVWSPAKTVHNNPQDRASLLKALGRCIKCVPHRDTLILAGDYNSSVTKQPRLVGPAATFPSRLVALNTWQPLSPHTFVQGDARTQIDFILTREISAGRQAKQASPLLDFPLGSWKKGGHRPIQAFVTPVRHWNWPGPQIKLLQHDSAALQEAVRANSPQAQRMLEWVTEHLDLDSGPQAWDELLIGATERFFPKTAVALPDCCPETAAARRLWRARRGGANRPSTEPPAEQHSTLQDQRKQAVKQARKDKAARFLQEVDQAIAIGGTNMWHTRLSRC